MPGPLADARAHASAGRFAEAEVIYRALLETSSADAQVWFEAGLVARRLGRVAEARARLEAAVAGFEDALARGPDVVEARADLARALFHLAALHQAAGQPELARGRYERILGFFPDDGQVHARLGRVHAASLRFPDAIRELGHAVELDPDLVDARNDLGVVLLRSGEPDRARAAFESALERSPGHPVACLNLAELLRDQGDLDRALTVCAQGLAANPRDPWLHALTGSVHARRRDLPAAERHLRAAAELGPDDPDLQVQLADRHRECGRLALALEHLGRALVLAPQHLRARVVRAQCLVQLSDVPAAIADLQSVLAVEPQPWLHSMLLLLLHYPSGIAPAEIFAEHRRFGALHGRAAPAPARAPVDRSPDRRLRIGYLSPDFRRHSVASFIAPVIAAHDRAAFEVFLYANVEHEDDVTRAIEQSADHFRSIWGQSDRRVIEQIGDDAIDVLIDLAGHTSNNRLGVLAMKPAPIQVTYLGYPDTTGVPAVDYRITDARADPPGEADALATETLVRLAGGFHCFRPPATAVPIAAAPSLASGRVAFGCFNRLAKITPPLMALWARILAAVPGSCLVVKSEGFASADVRTGFLAALMEHGVAPGRVELLPWAEDGGRHLAAYSSIDVALDCFPYNGTATTCEALYMGVPVVTLAGQTHVARVGASLLGQIGLEDLIALSPDEYVARAVALAGDHGRLAELRATLRSRVEQALGDAPRLARSLEAAYRAMWRRLVAVGTTASSPSGRG